MKVPSLDTSNVVDWEDLKRWITPLVSTIVGAINGKLIFGENIQSSYGSATFSAANTEVKVDHSLGRAPNGYIVVQNSANITVFTGVSGLDASSVYVQASGAGTVRLLIF